MSSISIITIRSRCHTYPHEWQGECFRYTHNGEIKTLSWREIKAIEKGLKSRQNDLLTTTEGRAWSLAKEDVCLQRLHPCSFPQHTHYRKGSPTGFIPALRARNMDVSTGGGCHYSFVP